MAFNLNTAFIEGKEKLFELIAIPIRFWFELPKIVHIIFYVFLIWFGCFIAYVIYTNRIEIFHKP
jgi:hypothetical protein